MEDITVMSEIQGFVDYYGFGITKEKLAGKAYHFMEMNGHECYILNGKYLGVDGQEYQFIKSMKENRWIVKEL